MLPTTPRKVDNSEVLKRNLLEKIQTEFPKIKIKESKLLTHGWDHEVLVANNQDIFRFPKDEDQLQRFYKEIKFLSYLKDKVAIPIPNYRYVAADKSFGGYAMLPGEEMETEKFELLNDKEQEKIAQQCAEFLTVIHSTPASEIERIGYVEEEGGHYWSKSNTENRFQKIKELVFPKLTEEEKSWIQRSFEKYLSLNFEYRKTLVHGDFTKAHILFDSNRKEITGVIDFGDVELGEPALDFAPLWHYYGESLVQKVLKYYNLPVDSDMLKRARCTPALHGPLTLLEIAQGDVIPRTWDEVRQMLADAMKKYPL